eukprot:gene6304-10310_t
MKFLVLLLCLFSLTFALKCERPLPEAGKCKCPATVKQVCTQSGKTYINACVAKCFKETVLYQGSCNNACTFKHSRSRKCNFQKYGKYGIRKYCCTHDKVCSGKQCERTNYKCAFSGLIIRKFPKMHCKWVKTGTNEEIRKCCGWKKVCKGKFCKNTKTFCKTLGKPVQIKSTIGCHFARAPGCSNGVRQKCCTRKHRCHGKKCKVVHKHCHYQGPVIRYKKRYTCRWLKMGRRGKRQRCCASTYKCQNHNCKLIKRNCNWSGWTVIRKTIRRCSYRKYGKGSRKRCCVWKIKCFNGKCTTVSKKCKWGGHVHYVKTRVKCFFKKVSKGKRQRHCCTSTFKCSNGCRQISRVCKPSGPIVTVQRKTKCKLVPSRRNNGYRKKCCSWKNICNGLKCKKKHKKCRYVGGLITKKTIVHCRRKVIAQNKLRKIICKKYCCSFKITCHGKKCRKSKRKCKCVSGHKTIYKKHYCHIRRKKNKSQKYCCTHDQVCYKGKCKKQKKKCHPVGFVTTIKHFKKCHWIKKKNYKQKVCCTWTRTCNGSKCHKSKKVCKKVGKYSVILNRHKCQILKYPGQKYPSKRKQCCYWKEQCIGSKCHQKGSKICKWSGPIYHKQFKFINKYKKCGSDKKGRRLFQCKQKTICLRQPKESKCDPKTEVCHICRSQPLSCVPKGECLSVYRKVKITLKLKRPNVHQKWKCVWKNICKGHICKKSNKKCMWFGPEIEKVTKKKCKTLYFQGGAERKQCCTRVKLCNLETLFCKKVSKKCHFVGPTIFHKIIKVCKIVHDHVRSYGNRVFKKRKCCRIHKRCVEGNCVLISKKCRTKGSITKVTHNKKCEWKFVKKPNSTATTKQRCCTYWTNICSGKRCQQHDRKTRCHGPKVKVTKTQKCHMKFFGESSKREYCCTRNTVCNGKKCHTFLSGCVWKGKPIPCVKGNLIYRWRKVCRPVTVGPNQIKTKCCDVRQKCEQITNYYICRRIKTGKCWIQGEKSEEPAPSPTVQ